MKAGVILKTIHHTGFENMRDLGSTENFNNIVSTKAPKNRYYGGSSSLKRRVSAAVLQKNEGHSYLVKEKKASSLFPGVYTSSLTQKIDQRRRVKRLHQRSLQYKRRRIQLQKQKRKKERISTVREGVTYEPN